MASGPGHLDPSGNACLKFHLCGVAHQPPGIEFEAIVDTGFTGFLSLPIQHAFSLQLPLEGTASYILADGSQSPSLTALGRATFHGKEVVGVVSLAFGSQDILVGMGFLRQFKMGIIILKEMVFLLDEDELEQAVAKKQAKGGTEPTATPPPEPTPSTSET